MNNSLVIKNKDKLTVHIFLEHEESKLSNDPYINIDEIERLHKNSYINYWLTGQRYKKLKELFNAGECKDIGDEEIINWDTFCKSILNVNKETVNLMIKNYKNLSWNEVQIANNSEIKPYTNLLIGNIENKEKREKLRKKTIDDGMTSKDVKREIKKKVNKNKMIPEAGQPASGVKKDKPKKISEILEKSDIEELSEIIDSPEIEDLSFATIIAEDSEGNKYPASAIIRAKVLGDKIVVWIQAPKFIGDLSVDPESLIKSMIFREGVKLT